MKAETTARTFYSVVVIAVIVILFAPLASALLNVSGNQWDVEIRTDSEYDLTWMDAGCLSSNLTEAVKDRTGCRILYGEYSEQVSVYNAYAVSQKVMSSGATTARVVGSDGGTLTQERISYRNAVAERTVMDIHLPDIISKISSIDLTIGYIGSGIVIPASSANVSSGNVVRADFTVPYVLKYSAMTFGCDEYVGVHVNYESNMKFDIDVRTDVDSKGYSFTTSGNDKDIISGVPPTDDAAGTIGDYTSFTVKNGVMELDGRNAAPSASMRNSLSKGPLAIASGNVSVTMTDESANALVNLLKELETRAGGFR
ncbi:MAG: hypothetical protein IKR86_05115 [Candidatus Methanomethylophilaceae archaeon]|nr:hypothetical protein [Candidatus Methanomethylophilaceae archaeon]